MNKFEGKEKKLAIGGIICLFVGLIFLLLITMRIGIIPFLILGLGCDVAACILLVYANKLRNERIRGTSSQTKPKKTPKKEEIKAEPKKEEVVKIEKKEETINATTEPNNVSEEDPFEKALKPKNEEKSEVVAASNSNKKIVAIIVVILVCLIAIGVTLFVVISNKNKNNNSDDKGGGSSSKVSFDITSNTYYEEVVSDNRIDGYLFKPNGDFVQYRFERFDEGFYVSNVEYGTWTYDTTTNFVHAKCTTYEYYDSYYDNWKSNSYSADAPNSFKDLKVVSSKKLYWNGNSEFVLNKVDSFTHTTTKYHS